MPKATNASALAHLLMLPSEVVLTYRREAPSSTCISAVYSLLFYASCQESQSQICTSLLKQSPSQKLTYSLHSELLDSGFILMLLLYLCPLIHFIFRDKDGDV